MSGVSFCADTSEARGESLVATASRVSRWLLVEHAEAWGTAAPPTHRLSAEQVTGLTRAAREGRARLLMIRRAAAHRARADEVGRQVFAVTSVPGQERVLHRHVTDDAGLADLSWPVDGESGWHEHDDPLYLVCTQGKHDRCCATRGRPVVTALAAAYGDLVWESSHVGGDRFAANLVVLPEGLYHGRVEPDDAVRLVRDLEAGRLSLDQVRGRSSHPTQVQAAQAFARRQLARSDRGGLGLVASDKLADDLWRVTLDGGVVVEVRLDRAGDHGAALLTCDSTEAKPAPAYRLVALSAP